jgi:hypothetical protein
MTSQDQRTEIFVALGTALDAWSAVERAVEALFAAISGTEIIVSHTIMASIRSFESRLELCTNMIALMKPAGAYRGFWNKCCRKIRDYELDRNQLAHFTIVEQCGPGAKPALVPYFSAGRMALNVIQKGKRKHKIADLNAQDIVERAQRFGALAYAIEWLGLELHVAMDMMKENPLQPNDLAREFLKPTERNI